MAVAEVAPTTADSATATTSIVSVPQETPLPEPQKEQGQRRDFWLTTRDFIFNAFSDLPVSNAYGMSWTCISIASDFVSEPARTIRQFKGNSNDELLTSCCVYSRCFCFLMITVQTWLVAIFVGKRPKLARRLLVSTFAFALVAAAITSFDPWFESLRQILWGFYVFIAVELSLLFLLHKSYCRNRVNAITGFIQTENP